MSLLRNVADKNLHTWLGGYARFLAGAAISRVASQVARQLPHPFGEQPPASDGPRHLLFALCDHFEPLWGDVVPSVGAARVRAWEEGYPKLAHEFTDSDGRHPRHSFFFPGEQYSTDSLERLARLTAAGLSEVEFHLHHDDDTALGLRRDLARYLAEFAAHGHLSRDPDGRLRFAFIHGNWCLANARRDHRFCGVDEEIPLLFEAGCYADFTFPSAPDECQPNIVNQIYWPDGDLARSRAYESGVPAHVGDRRNDRLLMISGPLALARRPNSLAPRIENAAVTANDPATPSRIRTWTAQNIHVSGRPEWVFVKVHTHGAPEAQASSLLGDGGRALHRALAEGYNDGERWRLHYVTAREMFNLAIAAMEGCGGDPMPHMNHVLAPPPVAGTRS